MAETPEIIEFTRVYLAVFFTSVASFYALRILIRRRRESLELIFPGQRFCSTWWNHMIFRIFRVTIWMVCVFRVFIPAIDNGLGMIDGLTTGPVIITGNILLTVGFTLTVAVHFELGQQWRSGIDPEGPQHLKTDGFYRLSRNPMFLSVAIAQLGFFLALPSVFSLLCLGIGWYTLGVQTRAEEKHLLGLFPDDYRVYQAGVRRWI